MNGCACGERKERLVNYQGDIQRLHEFGFDAAKFDGCGAQTNMTYYAELMKATGKSYAVENCHWGSCGADKWYHNPDGSSCPTHDWCPFNWYRTSGDINAGATSWLNNLQTTTQFQDYEKPLSVPGCWACTSACPALPPHLSRCLLPLAYLILPSSSAHLSTLPSHVPARLPLRISLSVSLQILTW